MTAAVETLGPNALPSQARPRPSSAPSSSSVGRTPADRIAALVDEESLWLDHGEPGSGMVTGVATIGGVPTTVFATDPSVMGGALGSQGCEAVVTAYGAAIRDRRPVVGLWHSGGARLAEGVDSLDGVGGIFSAMTRASGRIPQISVVLGPAAGGAAYGPALTDVVILGPEGRLFVTGPDVVRTVTGEDVDMATLGGPEPHGRRSGVVHVVSHSDLAALDAAAEAVEILAGHTRRATVDDRPLGRWLPESTRRAYDVRPLVDDLLDTPGLELHAGWAPNVITCLGRIGGRPVGVIANNPLRLAGCLDSASAEKAARFVRTCDAFGVPLVVLVDVPGYLPGLSQEWDGVVRRGAKLLHAFAEASVPRVTVVTRKAYGGAYIAMNSRALGASRVLAWPTAEVAVMGPVAAVRILRRRDLAAIPEQDRPAAEQRFAAEHERDTGGLDRAVELGVVDEVIDPGRTRSAVHDALRDAAATTPPVGGRHGNIPL